MARSVWCRWFGIGCPRPPTPPSFRTVAFVTYDKGVPIIGATVKMDGVGQGQTNVDGYLAFTRVPAEFPKSHLWATHPNYLPYDMHLDVPNGDVDFIVGDSGRPLGPKQVQLPAMEHPIPELPRLRAFTRFWMNQDGVATPLRGSSFFVGIRRQMLGEDIRPAIRYAKEVAGSNVLRVFTGMHYVTQNLGLGDLRPWEALSHLDEFLLTAKEEGMYVLLTTGDFQVLMPDKEEQKDYFAQLEAIAGPHSNVIGFGPNEPWKNGIEPFGFEAKTLALIPFSRGSSEGESSAYQPRLDFYEKHDERSLGEGGWKWVRHQWELKWMQPLNQSEPMGLGEMMIDGRRDNSPERFATAAAVGEVVGGGWVLHSDYGIAANIPPLMSAQNHATVEVGNIRRKLPHEMVTWHQTRTGLHDSALELDDSNTLRTFMRLGPGRGVAVAVRPTPQYKDAIRSRGGWTVVEYDKPLIWLEQR